VELLFILPLFIAFLLFFIPHKFVKDFALAFGVSFMIFSGIVFFQADTTKAFAYYSFKTFLPNFAFNINFAVDNVSFLLILLTNFVVMVVTFMAYSKSYPRLFYSLLFAFQWTQIMVFSAYNGLLFYLFWELALIPIFIMVLRWGKESAIYNVFVRFFVMTFIGSLFILAGFIMMLLSGSPESSDQILGFTLDLNKMIQIKWLPNISKYYLIFLLIGFGVKIPIFPLHIWQAKTYQKANAEATVLLSGIMLKMGLFGIIRWVLPFYHPSWHLILKVLVVLSVMGVLYGAIIAIRRNHLKIIAAYSSLSHVGLIAAGILTMNVYGLQGGIFQMMMHGINVAGLFYIIEVIYRSTKTHNIRDLGGLATQDRFFAVSSLIVILANVALPLTNGFPGELSLLMSIFLFHPFLGALAGLTVVFSAVYMLRIYQLVFFRTLTEKSTRFQPTNIVDKVILLIINVLILTFGIFPNVLMQFSDSFSNSLVGYIHF
jgi:NADH-quinone oxidoreductase subunit M